MLRLIQDQPISSVWPAAFQEFVSKERHPYVATCPAGVSEAASLSPLLGPRRFLGAL